MNYQQAVDYIFNIPRFRKKTDQKAIMHLLDLLGNPQKKIKFIHIAGTNGKGSVQAFLANILMEQGMKVGSFTSPHLVSVRERFQINQQNISKDEFLHMFQHVYENAKIMEQTEYGHPSFFEFVFAMAMCYFAIENVDFAIIEAGLGGRTDTTNCITPCLSIIANIGLDHTEILGDTIEKIAYEKAGIMKQNVPVVWSKQNQCALNVLQREVEKIEINVYDTNQYTVKILKNNRSGIDFSYNYEYDKEASFQIAMLGDYQVDNCITAITAARIVCPKVTQEEVAHAIRHTCWHGRMEQLKTGLFVDGAHNPQGMTGFVQCVNKIFANEDKVLVFAVASDKDDELMVSILKEVCWKHIIITEIDNNRKIPIEESRRKYGSMSSKVEYISNNKMALERAFEIQKENKESVIFCVGSLYLVSNIIELSGGLEHD